MLILFSVTLLCNLSAELYTIYIWIFHLHVKKALSTTDEENNGNEVEEMATEAALERHMVIANCTQL